MEIRKLKKFSESGYAEASFLLGYLYEDEKNNQEMAFQYFELSHNQGSDLASLKLASMLRSGIGCKRSLKNSFELLKSLAIKGIADAQAELAIYYLEGVGCKSDRDAYDEWIRKAANQNHVEALEIIADEVSINDEEQAIKLYEKAREHGSLSATFKLGEKFLESKNKSLFSIERAVAYLREASDNGNYQASRRLSEIYRTGTHDIIPDTEKHKYFYDLADSQFEAYKNSFKVKASEN